MDSFDEKLIALEQSKAKANGESANTTRAASMAYTNANQLIRMSVRQDQHC